MHVLFNHYIDGRMIFKNIYFNKPASHWSLKDNKWQYRIYWEPESFIKNEHRVISKEDIRDVFHGVTKQYITHLKPNKVSVPITGD